jgi:catechol 2,3-dioxygenase-like lactoylglutathione lyase family enzyme
MSAPVGRTPVVRYLFQVASDLAAVRRFYVDLLGLREVAWMDQPPQGWLSVEAGGFEMMWFRAEHPSPPRTEFTQQPGWEGGTREGISWAVEIPEARFAAAWRSLRESGVPLFRPVPEWRQDSYWGLSALDPAGVTVEVYTVPAARPAVTAWPES